MSDSVIRASRQILVIEDERDIAELIALHLIELPSEVTLANDGPGGLQLALRQPWDAIVLDLRLPGLNGLDLCREVRAQTSRVPILMLTARNSELDRVLGLELGADDYLAKPFSPRELLARLRAVLRRTQVDPNKEQLTVGTMSFDVAARSVQRAGQTVELTGLEFDLLLALARRAGRVVPRANLLELAGRSDVNVSDRTVDVHVSHIRKKLGDDDAVMLKTVRGVGYVLTRE